ncbi:glutaredoxin family protein [Tsukamurella columbiensis]|uniref:Glutaredoxin family protein n=1 Tax=Tsukamurella columbiensis TaxID=128509 RepID=A0ABX1LPE5_9ACTN|nr:glutaredoxin family protein [Tsukamurella columbiensis]NMD57981.1 glutaredoxin family protein [Tsukamurella columbiensis]
MTIIDTTPSAQAPPVERPAAEPWATVYTLPDCGMCMMTEKQLAKLGVPFQVVDLDSDAAAEARARFKAEGMRGAPVVETRDGGRWNQFRPEKIKATAVAYQRSGTSTRAMGACFGAAPNTTARPAAPPEAGRAGATAGGRTLAHEGSTAALSR